MNNKPITSRVQHATKGGMVREPLLSVGSVAKQKTQPPVVELSLIHI